MVYFWFSLFRSGYRGIVPFRDEADGSYGIACWVLSSPHTAINDPVSWLLHSCVSSMIAHLPVGLPNLCMLALVYVSKNWCILNVFRKNWCILSQNESCVHFKPPLRSWIHSGGHLQFDFSWSDNYPVKAITHSKCWETGQLKRTL